MQHAQFLFAVQNLSTLIQFVPSISFQVDVYHTKKEMLQHIFKALILFNVLLRRCGSNAQSI
ncbi:CLUMA_CG006190, isoform A [Clunio marinus]|uniref:CLUMA_CG006190, isoform A n=1 Tax=Clunio marinus TaxID=568069 RepID=A0A1J1HXA5_9DIPT|nr:CLUMA_CG006190, isoform A [Clunio marinus]